MTTPQPQRDTFAEFINDTFELYYGEKKVCDVRLTDVTPAEFQTIGEKKLETFSLFYNGPESPILGQSIYTLKHAKMGSLDQFLVPLGVKNGAVQYESVYNRFA